MKDNIHLVDYFAGQIANGYVVVDGGNELTEIQIAKFSYNIANALVEERERRIKSAEIRI